MPKNTICLWYDKDAEAAARFYAETFPDSAVTAVTHAPSDYPSGKRGDVLTVEFTVAGIPCLGLNGGTAFRHSEAFSFQIATDDQEETDRYWNAIVGNGGQESECGWCRDKWGISWQITPRVLTEALAVGGAEAKRAFEAMITMKKIDVATIEAVRRGDGNTVALAMRDEAAAGRLAELVAGHTVTCEPLDRDAYGRIVARCIAGGIDVGAQLVAEGLAWAFVRFSADYADLEESARKIGVGIWRAATQPLWEYRANRWERAAAEAPDGCPIKGDINRAGERIYHTPWSPWYGRTVIDEVAGERWFCDEAEAIEAGWRAARFSKFRCWGPAEKAGRKQPGRRLFSVCLTERRDQERSAFRILLPRSAWL